jgi:hypothetical protein
MEENWSVVVTDEIPMDPLEQIRQQNERLKAEGKPLPDPERDHVIRRAWHEEHARLKEEYKDVALPDVLHIFRQRMVEAGRLASEEHTAMKARQAAKKADT